MARHYLLRPTALFSNPPLCTVAELRTTLTLDDLEDMHEALDVRSALEERAAEEAERERRRR